MIFGTRPVVACTRRAPAYDAGMPELPEVETVRRGLAPHIEGKNVAHAVLHRPDLRFPLPDDFVARMSGAQVLRLSRRAKYLLADMRDKTGARFFWLSHLGMSGRYMVTPPKARAMAPGDYAHEVSAQAAAKHVHVELTFDDGTHLAYADPRRFGFMDVIATPEASPFLNKLGPEPLGNEFHADGLLAACQGRATPIKNLLLDQKVVAGLGNIYVCEALFLAGISPRRRAANIGAKRLARLVPQIRHVLARAIEAGGSSLRDFAHEDGGLGYFQHSFAVYDREGAPCSAPGCSASIKRIVQSGRSSFYCPSCQR
jgi:formamidopyrimidine-DNA glycosylase